MAITTLDGVVGGLPGQIIPYQKAALAGTLKAGANFSLWTATGNPSSGSAPTTAAAPTSATAGALPFTNPTGGALSYLGRAFASASAAGYLVFFDRLVHSGGLSGTVATAQTTNLPTTNIIPRGDTTGAGVELYLEWYTATGSTAATVTTSYTNQAGTSGRTSIATTVTASTIAASIILLPLQAGDTGVQSVQSVTLSISTGTAGNFGVTLARRLCEIPLNSAGWAQPMDVLALGMPQLNDNACVFGMFNPVSTAAPVVTGSCNIIQG